MTTNTALSRRAAKFAHLTSLLAQYTAAHDGANPGQDYTTPCGEALGEWVVTQRSRYRGAKSKTPLTEAETTALEQAGIIWTVARGRGDVATTTASAADYLNALARFRDEHGHANPATKVVVEGLKLGYWLRNKRQSESQNRLDSDLRQALLDLGVRFRDPENTGTTSHSPLARDARARAADQHFAQMLSRLAQYRQETGDARPVRSYTCPDGTPLGVWVSEQRQVNARGDLPQERVRALDEIGMVWVDAPGRRDFERTFTARLRCVEQYAADHDGNGNAPASFRCEHQDCEKQDLGQWLHRLRKKYLLDIADGKGRLTEEQVAALVERGVNLDPQGRARGRVSAQAA